MPDEELNKQNYPGNSRRQREADEEKPEKKRVEGPVVKGEVVRHEKSLGVKIKEYFTGDAQSVGQYILFDVLLPAAKDTIVDVFTQGIQRTMYGDSDRGRRSSGRSGYTSYNRMYTGGGYRDRDRDRDERPALSDRARSRHEFDEIVIPSRGEAEEVLDRLHVLIEEYGWATVNDFYDLVGLTGAFTDDKWGWEDLRDARVVHARNGFVINLPRTRSIP